MLAQLQGIACLGLRPIFLSHHSHPLMCLPMFDMVHKQKNFGSNVGKVTFNPLPQFCMRFLVKQKNKISVKNNNWGTTQIITWT